MCADNVGVDDSINDALQPASPGRVIRALAPVFPGVARTRDQILHHSEHWRARALDALADTERSERPELIVVLGDSLSQGIGSSSLESLWLDRLAAVEAERTGRAVADVVNLSRSGARIDDVIEVQLRAVRAIERPIGLITCTVGSNDLVRGASLRRAAASMRSLMARLPAGSALATLPANGSLQAKRLNKVIRRDAPDHGLVVADVDRLLTSWRGRSAGDRFHPNDAGYEIWVDAFTRALDERAAPSTTASTTTGPTVPIS